jgi:hypothetical protein
MKLRTPISAAIGGGAAVVCWVFLSHQPQLGAGDFNWAIRAARDLLHGSDPYHHTFGYEAVPYPLPAALFGLPFIALSPAVAGAAFIGISSAVLAFGLTRKSYAPLLVFLSYPYVAAVFAVQWTPLLMAAALFPALLPATLAKPNLGASVVLMQGSGSPADPLLARRAGTSRGMLWTAAIALLSLVLMPSWPLRWLAQTGGYLHFFPILAGLGPALFLALFWRRDPGAQLLLLLALTPQRWFYDPLLLWLIPRHRREFVATVFLSWGAGLMRMHRFPASPNEAGSWMVLWFYFPMLALLASRHLIATKYPAPGEHAYAAAQAQGAGE